MAALHGGVGQRRDPLLLQPQHDLDVQRLHRRRLAARQPMAEADDVDLDRRRQLKGRLGLDQVCEVAGLGDVLVDQPAERLRSEEHTSELQSLMRISYAVFCLQKKNNTTVPTDINLCSDYKV